MAFHRCHGNLHIDEGGLALGDDLAGGSEAELGVFGHLDDDLLVVGGLGVAHRQGHLSLLLRRDDGGVGGAGDVHHVVVVQRPLEVVLVGCVAVHQCGRNCLAVAVGLHLDDGLSHADAVVGGGGRGDDHQDLSLVGGLPVADGDVGHALLDAPDATLSVLAHNLYDGTVA